MPLALVLQDVAVTLTQGDAALRSHDPARFAYVLREAIDLAQPDWIVTHHDVQLEAAAAAASAASFDDVADVALANAEPVAGAITLCETLKGIYPSRVVAASIAGPATMAAALSQQLGPADAEDAVLDCGDALAELASAYVAAGAGRIVVWETAPGDASAELLADASRPIVRRLATLGVDAVACGPAGLAHAGYAAVEGDGLAVLPDAAFSAPASLTAALQAVPDGAVVVSDGPVPAGCEPTLLKHLGERTRS